VISDKIKTILTSRFIGRTLFIEDKLNDNKVYFIQVEPVKIGFRSLVPENSAVFRGDRAFTGIYGGMWDRFKRPFTQYFLYKTVSEIMVGKRLEESALNEKVKEGSITSGQAEKQFDKLIHRMKVLKNEGYRSQYELDKLNEMRTVGNLRVPLHEMIVGMDRNGKLIRLVGGKHRLAIAQQIGTEKMYAVLSLVHPNAVDKLPDKRRVITGNSEEDFRPFD